MRFQQTKLSNGMSVIAEIRESAASAAIGFFVQTGARDEESPVAGVSHFLEHMMFKGTEKRSALDVTYDLARMGAQANAYTSEENTVYHMQVLPEYFSQAIELLSDMMRPALSEEEYNTEKKVILEEIALYKDRPTHMLFEAAVREHFQGHPAGNSVLGTTESISALTVDQMRNYFQERYSPVNIVLAASGNLNWEEFIELAEKYCAHWPAIAVDRERRTHHAQPSSIRLTKKELQLAHACLISEGPSAQSELRYASHVLSCILGDSSGSKVYWELVDPGLADTAFIDSENMDHVGFVYGYVSAEPERIDEMTSRLMQIMERPLEFSPEDLERALTKLRTRLVLQGESTMRRLMAIGNEWISRKRYRTLDEELARLAAVNRSEIEDLLQHFPLQPVTSVALEPA